MDVYEALIRELGADRVLRGPEAVAPYARDESGLGVYPPEAAVLCRTRAEVELTLRFAAAHQIPVTPRGAGSGHDWWRAARSAAASCCRPSR